MTKPADIGQTALGHLALGKEFLESGRSGLALAEIGKALDLQPDLAQAHFLKGVVLVKLADFQVAEASFETSTRLDPSQAGSWLGLAHVRRETGRVEEALEAARGAAEADPGNPTAWLFQGNLLRALGRDGESLAAYRRSVERNPFSTMARNKLAVVLADLGRPNEAEVELMDLLRLDPLSWRGRTSLGDLHHQRGELPEACAEYRAACELDADHASVPRAKLAQALADLGELEEARKAIERAVREDDRQVGSLLLLGDLHARLGSPRDALDAWRRALDLDPDYPPTKRRLAELGRGGASLGDATRSDEDVGGDGAGTAG